MSYLTNPSAQTARNDEMGEGALSVHSQWPVNMGRGSLEQIGVVFCTGSASCMTRAVSV